MGGNALGSHGRENMEESLGARPTKVPHNIILACREEKERNRALLKKETGEFCFNI